MFILSKSYTSMCIGLLYVCELHRATGSIGFKATGFKIVDPRIPEKS